MKKRNKQISLNKILIICLVILIPVVIAMLAFHKIPVNQTTSLSGGEYSHTDNSLVTYNQQDVSRLAELEHSRQVLSPTDAAIRQNLIKRGSPLAATNDFTITYDPNTDIFQAQINTISIDFAKREVDQWFFDQGMSVEAPCELPVSFILENSIADSLKGFDVVFSPIAPGC